MHDLGRLPRGQDFVSSCRVVTCRQASAGTRVGTSGKQSGNAHLTGAFAEADTLGLRNHPNGQTRLSRVEKTYGTGKARSILAHTLARAA